MLLKDFDQSYHRLLHEIEVDGKRLGRHIVWEPSFVNSSIEPYLSPTATVKTQEWKRMIPVLNQGSLGSCTANAALGMAGTEPFYQFNIGKTLTEPVAVLDYEYETTIDGLGTPYPPNDRGSSGQAAVQTLVAKKFAAEYYFALDFNTALLTLANYGPVIFGINWYDGFDTPSPEGIVALTGSVRGGHEVECVGVDTETSMLHFYNSWGTGWGVGGQFWMPFDVMETLFNQQASCCTIGITPTTNSEDPSKQVVS